MLGLMQAHIDVMGFRRNEELACAFSKQHMVFQYSLPSNSRVLNSLGIYRQVRYKSDYPILSIKEVSLISSRKKKVEEEKENKGDHDGVGSKGRLLHDGPLWLKRNF